METFDRIINIAVYIIVIKNYSYLFCPVTAYGKDKNIPIESYELLGQILAGFPSYSNF